MIRGQIVFVGPLEQGVGKTSGKEWMKQLYVIQTEGQYSKKVAFSILGDKITKFNLQQGQIVEVEVDAQSREYNGRWYTDLTAWRVNNLGNAAPVQTYQQPAQNQNVYQQAAPQGYTAAQNPQPANPFGQSEPSGDLPF